MDDISPSNVDFKCIFEKFQVDEVSIDEAEDDICFNAQVMFEGASCVGLNRLKYTEDESTVEKRMYQFMNHHWKWVSSINWLKCSKCAKFLRDLKQEMEQSDGLSNGYARNERKFTADQIVHFKFTYHPKNCKQSTFLNSTLEYTLLQIKLHSSKFSPTKTFLQTVWKSDFQKTSLQIYWWSWSLLSWCCPNEHFWKTSGSDRNSQPFKNILTKFGYDPRSFSRDEIHS